MRRLCLIGAMTLLSFALRAQGPSQEAAKRTARIKDIVTVEGVRDNPLVGYGMVVGLNNTGDRQQTIFSTQTLANILQRMGLQIPSSTVVVKNVAAVFVTATLPPFAHPGIRIDATVSSIGDARSLEGGLLLLTPLQGADGQAYAEAQGPLTLGGYTAGRVGAIRQVNHPTVGRIPAGAIVERGFSTDLPRLPKFSLLLRDADFSTARRLAEAINQETVKPLARAADGRSVEINSAEAGAEDLAGLMARIENLEITVERRAKVIVNERTGTVVMGSEVRLGEVSILHGGLTIDITTKFQVSQPNPEAGGETKVVPETKTTATQAPAQRVELPPGATVETLVRGLQAIGATARDIVAILQAIKAAGALDAELEVI